MTSFDVDQPSPPSRVARALRLLVILLFALWAWQGPTRLRVFHEQDLAWSYKFFRRQGEGACDIRYYEAEDGGGLTYIERWKVFGYDRPDDMPRPLRVVGPIKQVPGHTAKFCRLLKKQRGEPVDVRAKIRCPNWDSWTKFETGRRNVCDPKQLAKASRRYAKTLRKYNRKRKLERKRQQAKR